MKGAEAFCAIRSYLATAARHGIGWLDALTRAAAGIPWIPGTADKPPGTKRRQPRVQSSPVSARTQPT
jgi:hypothetical protein